MIRKKEHSTRLGIPEGKRALGTPKRSWQNSEKKDIASSMYDSTHA
jgi:hypothetical protein